MTTLLAQVPPTPGIWPLLTIGLIVFLGIILLFLVIFFAKFFNLWIQSITTGAGVGFFDLIGMWLRKVNATVIVRSQIMAIQAGLKVESKRLEAHYLAGGNVPYVIKAMIAAHRAQISLEFNQATAIDLAGRNVLDAVQTSVNPKVIDCPDPSKGKPLLEAVARNGIQLRTKARVTVRTNLATLIGGATEETIIARVGEGIVSAIGSAADHYHVLADPGLISKAVLAKGLDSQTSFEIVSIDIADVEPGENVGARLQLDQAETDKRVAQAKAETARTAAVAREQEMMALVAENRAKVVLAEAEIPLAIAAALREGKLGVMDYYSLRNLQADTEMRSAIATPARFAGGDSKTGS
ncbi:MAG: flotillin-like protein FloA [Planctomycetes bacterium]|nr:flotillin-like protein FloA [Planctomycetota bacterium]